MFGKKKKKRWPFLGDPLIEKMETTRTKEVESRTLLLFQLCFFFISYLFERQKMRYRERDISHLLAPSTNAHTSQGCVRLTPGPKNPIHVSHMGSENSTAWAVTGCSLACTSRKLEGRTQLGLTPGSWYGTWISCGISAAEPNIHLRAILQ